MMMGKESAKDDSDRIINVIVNEGRKYGIGLVLATQRFEHVSQDIRTNIACKLGVFKSLCQILHLEILKRLTHEHL